MPNWKSEDDNLLLGMARLGASAARIAAALNRKIHTVRSRARFLGCYLLSIADQRRAVLKQCNLTGRSDQGLRYPRMPPL
jgi:hypothetical protein